MVGQRQMVVRKEENQLPTLPTLDEVTPFVSASASIVPVTTPAGTYQVIGIPSWPATDAHQTPAAASNLIAVDFRSLFSLMDPTDFAAAVKARQILYWHTHSKFCPVCGTQTEPFTDIARKCPKCGFEIYPPISPAIIVRVERGNEILMVRALNFRGDHYGLVAGFVETGESLEECVRREVMEETGLEIDNIRYFASQPWPFPSNLMIGFVARYVSGDIKIQKEELADAQFFNRHNLPNLPDKLSIARRLIDDWLENN